MLYNCFYFNFVRIFLLVKNNIYFQFMHLYSHLKSLNCVFMNSIIKPFTNIGSLHDSNSYS